MPQDLDSIKEALRKFAHDRQWDKYHSPKNIAMALTVEAAELQEIFQWMSEEESASPDSDTLQAIKHEIADVFLYLLTISRVLNIDILDAATEKLALNAIKYPLDKSRGNATKYTKL
ncbi:MAG: nucleotide pyrophosphohydrolase [Alcaligenaceae bacterium]|nr:nucleotide pyrophosphohydrolase [Alcaligenaceae bacterium]